MDLYKGILPVLKPSGWTSHDVVMKVRRILKTKKIGHTGTLDPDVSGVLPVCIGRATRVVQFLTECDKEYICTVGIGVATTTEDASGEKIAENLSMKRFTREQIVNAIEGFKGEYEQTPPMYSAIKVNGKKLYEYARKGEIIARPTRMVRIHEITLLDENDIFSGEEVCFTFRVNCSKGTYIRTLAVDIGNKLGFPAHMKQLKRTKSGSFVWEDCATLEEIEQAVQDDQLEHILFPLERGIAHLPKAVVNDATILDVKNGKKIHLPVQFKEENWIGIFDENGKSYAVYEPSEDKLYKPVRVFISANEDDD